ncbi:MAG: hypothetical protein E6Q24_15220 [Chitinophagaceae bacterium]|nr:MAG: hypothetical protein E6Q24_15220 [Chitinophagaceae bacterium]
MKGIITAISIVFLFGCITSGYAQSATDSVVMQYLRTVKGIPEPVLTITKKKGRGVRSANFFVEPIDSLSRGKMKINTFLFGSAASHNRKYFLIQVRTTETTIDKIIDSLHLEQATAALFGFIEQFQLTDAEKSILIRALTYAYN